MDAGAPREKGDKESGMEEQARKIVELKEAVRGYEIGGGMHTNEEVKRDIKKQVRAEVEQRIRDEVGLQLNKQRRMNNEVKFIVYRWGVRRACHGGCQWSSRLEGSRWHPHYHPCLPSSCCLWLLPLSVLDPFMRQVGGVVGMGASLWSNKHEGTTQAVEHSTHCNASNYRGAQNHAYWSTWSSCRSPSHRPRNRESMLQIISAYLFPPTISPSPPYYLWVPQGLKRPTPQTSY